MRYSAKGARLTRDWTRGSIFNNLLSLAWPVMISQSLNMIGPLIDMIWIGKLGSVAVAGVGLAGMVVTVANASLYSLVVGQRAVVARLVGAGDKASANNATLHAFIVGIGYSMLLAVTGAILTEPILRALGVAPDVVAAGAIYLRIQFLGIATMSLRMFTEGAMQSSGDSMTPMYLGLIFRAFHIALCPFFIFGWWIFPEMGIAGASIINVVSLSLGGFLGLWVLFSGRTRLRLTLKNFRLDLKIIWRMLKIGIPNLFMHIQHHTSILIFAWLLTPFGTLAVAAHSLWQRVDNVLATMSSGVGIGAGVLGGQNLGAKQPERAEKSGWVGACVSAGFLGTSSIVILLFAERIVAIFSPEPGLADLSAAFLRVAAVGYLGLAFNNVFMNFLTGIGDTWPAFLLELLQTYGVQIPLAYFLSRYTHLEVYGVRWGMVAGLIFAGIAFSIYFRWGGWKRKKV